MSVPTPTPAAITQAELDRPISAATIAERLTYVNNFRASIEGADPADPGVLTKTINLFAISTHNVIDHSLPQDPYMKRKLFCTTQWSLQILAHCINARLEMGYDDTIGVDDVEKRLRTIYTEPVHFTNPFARERHAVPFSDYEQLVNTPLAELSKSGLPLHTFQTLLGEHVVYTQSTGIQVPLTAFHASAALGGDDRTLRKKRTSEFAVGVLICLAKSVSVKFRNHPLVLLGTMIPASSFQ